MIYPSSQQLLVAALCLVIPVAIVLGHRWFNEPIAVCSGAAFIAFTIFWLLLGGTNPQTGVVWPGSILIFSGGALLLLAASALALNAATQARRWGWVALLTTAAYLSALAIVYSISQPDPCIFGPNPDLTHGYGMGQVCTAVYPLVYWLVVAGYLAGPVAALAYGLRPDGLRRTSRVLPDGLSVTSLRGTSSPTQETID